jgi:hypothetical protein
VNVGSEGMHNTELTEVQGDSEEEMLNRASKSRIQILVNILIVIGTTSL